jgi:lysophospholipase L1-like esterase
MFHGSGMRPWDENFKTAVMPDGTHANEAGHKIMATKIHAFLEELLTYWWNGGHFTEADKTEMVNRVISALPTWNGGSY